MTINYRQYTVISLFIIIFMLITQNCLAITSSKNDMIIMKDNYFSPKTMTIPVGRAVTWINKGIHDHTVTSNKGGFDSGHVQPGARFSYTFTHPGTYPYLCTIHSLLGFGMRGEIIVR